MRTLDLIAVVLFLAALLGWLWLARHPLQELPQLAPSACRTASAGCRT